MEKFSVREVIEQAVRTERLGYEFYTSMSKKFKGNEGLVKLFSTLAAKELQHERSFSELKGIIGGEEPEGWEDASEYLRAIVESEFFLGTGKSLPSLDYVKTAADAVDFALGFEKETLLYYQGLRDSLKEDEVIDEIINDERSHIKWLHKFKETFK